MIRKKTIRNKSPPLGKGALHVFALQQRRLTQALFRFFPYLYAKNTTLASFGGFSLFAFGILGAKK
jgi:hypothetical protein